MDDSSLQIRFLIGSRIRTIREERGMTQAELSEKAGISLPHVSDIELGKVDLRITTFRRLIEVLQVSADSILLPDLPQTKLHFQEEFAELLTDSSPGELEALLRILREIKKVWRTDKNEIN